MKILMKIARFVDGKHLVKVFFIICDYNVIFYRIYSDNFRGKSTTYFQFLSSPLRELSH